MSERLDDEIENKVAVRLAGIRSLPVAIAGHGLGGRREDASGQPLPCLRGLRARQPEPHQSERRATARQIPAAGRSARRGLGPDPRHHPEPLPAAVRTSSPFLAVALSARQPALESLAVDSLGLGKCELNTLHPPAASAVAFKVHGVFGHATRLEYRRPDTPGDAVPGWTIEAADHAIQLVSQYSAGERPDPIVCNFDTARCHTTLLGLLQPGGGVSLPAILHLPGHGTFRISGPGSLGYQSGDGFVKVTFPAATAARSRVEYHLEVTTICPHVAGIDNDPRFNGFRRNWLNVLQLNPSRCVLSNNTASDTCGFCYYEYADIALHTPPLAGNLTALDVMRQTLEQVLAGTKTYGMPGYGDFPEVSADTYPSLLIAADDCTRGGKDQPWLEKNYAGIKQWADKMLATDRQGNGLIKYDSVTGNSGSWNEGQPEEPAFQLVGHDRLRPRRCLRQRLGVPRLAEHGTHGAGNPTTRTMRPATTPPPKSCGPLISTPSTTRPPACWPAGAAPTANCTTTTSSSSTASPSTMAWCRKTRPTPSWTASWPRCGRSVTRVLTWVCRATWFRWPARTMCTRIRGLAADAARTTPTASRSTRTAAPPAASPTSRWRPCMTLGRREEADRMLMPMLQGVRSKGRFEGKGANGMSNDWRAWDGTAWGYEGFLVDNYYTLLAVLARDKAAQASTMSTEIGPYETH